MSKSKEQLRRLELDKILRSILGSSNVYFQPPSNHTMKYPCIVYKFENHDTRYSGNHPYTQQRRYQITVIDKDPSSDLYFGVCALPMSSLTTRFTSDGLNHTVITLYY